MSPERRYVFDSNTLISALLFKGSVPGRAFDTALQRGQVLASEATFTELKAVLERDKFDRYVTRDEREQFLMAFLHDTTLIEVNEEIRASRDAMDDKFLELAVAGSASCIITGDPDLLVLHPFRGIAILNPAAFLHWLEGEQDGR